MPNFFSILFTVIFILAGPASTPATVLIPKDFKDLTREADLVFIGTVTDIHSAWSDPNQNSIYTYVTFSNLEIVAGEHNDDSITVRLSGGEIDNVRVAYAGIPEFKVGEKNLVFLKGNFIQLCPVVGWVQGRFHVVYDQSIRDEIVLTNDLKPVGEIQNNKIVTTRDVSQEVTGSPGIPDTPQAQVKAIQGPDRKMTAATFINAVRDLRSKLHTAGEKLGYVPLTAGHSGIPADALNSSAGKTPERGKVVGYDDVPRPMTAPSPKPDAE